MSGSPLSSRIATVHAAVGAGRRVKDMSITNLAVAIDDDVRVVEHVSVFTTAEDTAFHPGRAVDGDISIVHVGVIVVVGMVRTLTGTKHMTCVVGTARSRHLHVVRTDITVADGHVADAGAYSTAGGLATCLGEVTHVSHITTAIDIAGNKGSVTGWGNGLFHASDFIEPFSSTDIYICVTNDVSLVTTTKDIANGANGKNLVATGIFFVFGKIIVAILFLGILLKNHTLCHVHIDMRITNYRGLVATTVNRIYRCGRDDVDVRVAMRRGQCTGLSWVVWLFLLDFAFRMI